VRWDSRDFRCDFPDAEWSRRYFERAVGCAQEIQIPYRIQTTDRTDTTRFLTVKFSGNIDKAKLFIRCVFQKVFELPEETPILLWFENVDVVVRSQRNKQKATGGV
jgi:hypothetical protein